MVAILTAYRVSGPPSGTEYWRTLSTKTGLKVGGGRLARPRRVPRRFRMDHLSPYEVDKANGTPDSVGSVQIGSTPRRSALGTSWRY